MTVAFKPVLQVAELQDYSTTPSQMLVRVLINGVKGVVNKRTIVHSSIIYIISFIYRVYENVQLTSYTLT